MARRPAKTNPTIVRLADLSAELKLSKTAVSRVLSQVPAARSIPPETQARIFSAAKRMGYVPNLLARSLQKGSSRTIAVIVPNLVDAYNAHVVGGLEDVFGSSERACFVLQHHSSREKLNKLDEVVKLRRADGLVTISSALPWTTSLPLVTVACPDPPTNACNLQLDHIRTAQIGLQRLKSRGYNRIALICGQDESPDARPRAAAILQVASKLDILVAPELIEKLGGDEPSVGPGYKATQRLLSRNPAFSAIFAFNDYTAIGTIRALREKGLRVPDDVAVLGVDDVQPAAYNDPPLTTIRQPLFRMGQLAARKLMGKIEEQANGDTGEVILIRPILVPRDSA